MRSSASFDILGIGILAVDDVLHVAAYPPADEKAEVLRKDRQFGGLVGTALAAASRLGARCAYAGVLGGDELSASIRAGLVEAGVNVDHVIHQPAAGPVHSVIVADDSTGTRNIFFDLVPMQALPIEAVNRSLIAPARVLFIDQLGLEAKLLAARFAHELSVPVVADAEFASAPGTDDFLAVVDHLIVSRGFASQATGESDPAHAAIRLHRRHPRTCTVVTCGREGCFSVVGDISQARHEPARPVTVVETTGCGDVFHGAYAASLAQGCEVPACIARASAAAAVYASRPSGWQHLPTVDDLAELLNTGG